MVTTVMVRFPTTGNTVLANGVACNAELLIEFDSMGPAAGRSLVAEYCSEAWPIGTEDWTATTGETAIPSGRVLLDDPAPEGETSIPLDNPGNITAASDAGFCFGIDGGAPADLAGTSFTSFDTTAVIRTPVVVPPQLHVWVVGDTPTATPTSTPTHQERAKSV